MNKILELYKLIIFFFSKYPLLTILNIIIVLLSQVFLLVSYFLPIKIILLLNTNSIPNVINSYFYNLSRNDSILILTFSVFIFYGLHIFFEKATVYIKNKILINIFLLEDKSHLKTKAFVYKFFDSFMKCISTLSLVIILYILILSIYPLIAIVMLFYIILCIVLLYIMKLYQKKIDDFFRIFSGIGFLLIFIVEVLDSLYFNTIDYSIIVILVTLILSRYISTRTIFILNKLLFLYNTKNIFFINYEKKLFI